MLTVDKNGSFANGQATDDATVRVSVINDHPVANAKVAWALEAPAKIAESQAVTDAEGLALVKATSLVPGESVLSVSSGDLSDQKALQFVVNAEQAKITDFSVTVNNSPANGKTQNSALITVKDPSGDPVKDQPVKDSPVTFSTTGHGVLSATTVNSDANGEAVVTETDVTPEVVTVTAKSADYTLDAGKSTTGEFTQDQITAVTANGKSFAPDAGFPKTGFLSGTFTLEIGGTTANNGNYTYTTDNNWLRPDSVPGKFNMVSSPTVDTKRVTLTATPKSGQGQPLTYVVNLEHWFTNIARSSANPTIADQDCLNKSMTTPGYKLFSNVPAGSQGVRAVGSLWGEWGDLGSYNWSTSSGAESMWAAENGVNGTRIFVHWRDGYVNQNIPSDNMDEVCLTF